MLALLPWFARLAARLGLSCLRFLVGAPASLLHLLAANRLVGRLSLRPGALSTAVLSLALASLLILRTLPSL